MAMISSVAIHSPQAHLQNLAICTVDGTPVEMEADFARAEAWLTEKAPGGWRWYAREATEAGIKAGHDAHQQLMPNPLVIGVRLVGVPFIFEIDSAEVAVLFKMFVEGTDG